MSKLVYGKGFNDRSRPTKVDGKNVKEYKLWQDMLKRCLVKSIKHINQPIKVVMFLITSLITHSFTIGVRTKLGLVRLMKKEEVGVWIRICYLLVTKHILRPLVFTLLIIYTYFFICNSQFCCGSFLTIK